MRLKVNVKIVPDHRPNSEGEWHTIVVDENVVRPYRPTIWQELTSKVGAGHHVVDYKIVGEVRTRM